MKTKPFDFLTIIDANQVKSFLMNNKNTANSSIKVVLTKKDLRA